MNVFTSADLEKMLGVKGHIIRYWEKEIPLVQARKDGTGKLVYSKKDVQSLLRIKYLVQEKKYTLEGAREQLYREQENAREERGQTLAAVRGELLNMYVLNREQKKILREF
ncbi:MAG: MerR family transcriptional regulator [Spirochaetaceae bacterium]|jgi:DNA-binding transcriptional MerR regulator|nr:MerR family transcriptional regulator [Spirochaetaceae bacterium]